MAGHFTGIVNPDGTPFNGDFNLINNYAEHIIADTVEQMYGMIWYLADSLAGQISTGKVDHRTLRLQLIGDALRCAEVGIEMGKRES